MLSDETRWTFSTHKNREDKESMRISLLKALQTLLVSTHASRLSAPRSVPLTERPLEQQPPLGGVSDDTALTEADYLTSAAASAAMASTLGTAGTFLLDEIVPPLADGPSNVGAPAAIDSPSPLVPPERPLPPTPPPGRPLGSMLRRSRRSRPPSPPVQRERPLLGNLTAIAGHSSRYVRTHVGVEAACALLLAALLSLCAVAMVARAFFDYSLCCFSRGAKPGRLGPRVGEAS